MAVRKVVERPYEPNSNNEVYTYFEGFCNSDDDKPEKYVAQGSNLMEVDSGITKFYDEKTGSWNTLMTASVPRSIQILRSFPPHLLRKLLSMRSRA